MAGSKRNAKRSSSRKPPSSDPSPRQERTGEVPVGTMTATKVSNRSRSSVHSPTSAWRLPTKIIVSLLLCYHVLAMFASPWAIPPTSSLALASEAVVRHYQTVLYLNHGYRFFAPNPGPASVIVYRLEFEDGRRTEGLFPDRNAINRDYPRLLYHRWFMLSESIGNFLGEQVSETEFLEFQKQEQTRQQELRRQGLLAEADLLAEDIQTNQMLWDEAVELRRQLITPLAKRLLKKSGAVSIELFLNRRLIPSPDQIRRGAKTRDPQFLPDTTLVELGRWTKQDFSAPPTRETTILQNEEKNEASEALPLPLGMIGRFEQPGGFW